MIKEDLEVTLTNEEASDFFDIDPKDLLNELTEEQEIVEFSLGTLGKLAGGAAKLLSSENFRRTAVQLFLRMAEKELTEHIRNSADSIAQRVVPDIPFDGDILESLMQRTFSRILAEQSDELSKSIIDIITNGFIERLMGDPDIREHLAEAMGRASKATKTPPDATKAEKKAANKRVRKAGKEDSKKELDEKKLTKPEKKELKSLEKKTPKKDFKDQYGDKEGESIYYATLTKKAKEKA